MLSWYGYRFEEEDQHWGPMGPSTQNGYITAVEPFYFLDSGFVRAVNNKIDYFGRIGWQWSSSAINIYAYNVGFSLKTIWIAGLDGKGYFGSSLCLVELWFSE